MQGAASSVPAIVSQGHWEERHRAQDYSPSHKMAAIVLAAGMSQRMGRLKALLPFGEKPMIARVVESLQAVGAIFPIIVVTGHAAEEISAPLDVYKPVFVHNPDYAGGGMLSSIQAGVRALPRDSDAFLLALGDQPMVRPETIHSLIAAWQQRQAMLAVPAFQGKRGHPVLFSATCIPEILALSPDSTLKTVVSRHAADCREVVVSDPAVAEDVDTPEDYTRALTRWEALTIGPPSSRPPFPQEQEEGGEKQSVSYSRS